MKKPIPEGKLARIGVAGGAAMRMGLGALGHHSKRPFLSRKRQQASKEALEDRNAQLLFQALTQLRGAALKVAQMLSMEADLLPERYRLELEKSYYRVPPLNRALVRKAIVQAFGKPPEALFAEFNDVAFAAASLGQVHQAKLDDGSAVAVKIQYPGIHVAMNNDLSLMRQLSRGLPNAALVLKSVQEIQERLSEEVDYAQELRNTRWFAQNLQIDGVNAPRVYEAFSSERVLTTGLQQGRHLDDWLAQNPSQELRDMAAQRIYDLLMHCIMDLRCLHADPNPGNYLIRDDGQIELIDFGCVKHLSRRFTEILPRLLRAYIDDDQQTLFEEYHALGMRYADEGSRLYQEVLRPFGKWLAKPFNEEQFDFAKHSDYTASGKQVIQDLINLSGVETLADEFVFFDRTLYGIYKIFERLGGKVRIRHHWVEQLPKNQCVSRPPGTAGVWP